MPPPGKHPEAYLSTEAELGPQISSHLAAMIEGLTPRDHQERIRRAPERMSERRSKFELKCASTTEAVYPSIPGLSLVVQSSREGAAIRGRDSKHGATLSSFGTLCRL